MAQCTKRNKLHKTATMRPRKVAPRPKFIVIPNQGHIEVGQWGHNSLGAESLWGWRITAGGTEKSQQCHKYLP